VQERAIVVEERLRTRGLVILLASIGVAFIAASVALVSGLSTPPLAFYFIEAFVVIVFVCAVLAFSRIVVRVVETPPGRTLEVLYGPRGVVRQEFGPGRLVSAQARNYSMMQMGGWGYRGSLKLLRQAAVVTRSGAALDVRLKGKRRFIVTVDSPEDFIHALELPAY
jgi:hypothetical protein